MYSASRLCRFYMLWYLMSSQIQSWVKTTIMPKKMILYENCWQVLRENDFYAWNERLNTICLKGLMTAQNFLSGWYDQLCMFSKPGSFEISSLQRLQIYTLSKHTQMQLPTVLQYIIIHFFSMKNPFSETKLMISYSLYLLFLNKNIIQMVAWQPHICSTPYDPMTG